MDAHAYAFDRVSHTTTTTTMGRAYTYFYLHTYLTRNNIRQVVFIDIRYFFILSFSHTLLEVCLCVCENGRTSGVHRAVDERTRWLMRSRNNVQEKKIHLTRRHGAGGGGSARVRVVVAGSRASAYRPGRSISPLTNPRGSRFYFN